MTRTPATMDTSSWQSLLGLDVRHPGDKAIVAALLDRLRRSSGWLQAGLYLDGGEGDCRRLVVGEDDLPLTVEEAGDDLESLDLPGSRLLYRPGAGGRPPEETALVALIAAADACRLRQELERERFAVNYRGVGVEALYDVGLAIASTLDFDQLCDEILLRAVSLLDARRGALYLLDEGSYRLVQTLGGAGRERVARDEPVIEALLAGRQEAGDGLLPGSQHLLAVPIQIDSDPRGLLVVADKESRRGVGPFPESDGRTLGLFANQAAIALENARLHRDALEKERLEREIQLAADIQQRLLPKTYPEIEGFELVGWSRPARHVGGDYYNLLPRPGGRLAAVVADVSGKGMPAALMVSTAHSALNLLLDRADIGADLIERLNRHILDASAPNKFITLLLAEIDPPSGGVNYVNAGHNPALLVRAGGGVEELAPGGLPLGMFAGSYRDGRAELGSGDLLCLFSDGITEAEEPGGEEFGPGRLTDLLRRGAEQPLSDLVASIDS
ncbi:MAG: PP2C family protein-serine/threonine phosphatase, partial [Thermoanaerobaculia bacterium]